jgi:hypothetical protein
MIQRMGAAAGDGTSIALPTHQARDVLIIFAYNAAAATAPSLPAGWSNVRSQTYPTQNIAQRTGAFYATSSAEVSGTWTNATGLIAVVYRGTSATSIFDWLGAVNTYGGTAFEDVQYSSLTAVIPSSLVVQFAAYSAAGVSLELPPAPLKNFTKVNGASATYAAHDGPLSLDNATITFPTTTVNIGVQSAPYYTCGLEIRVPKFALNNYHSVRVGSGLSTGERIH